MRKVIYKIVIFLFFIPFLLFSKSSDAQHTKQLKYGKYSFNVPAEYFEEGENIPSFWINSNEDVKGFLFKTVRKGKIEVIGTSAGGRPIYAVIYGKPRESKGKTTTFSGSMGYGNVAVYRGKDHDKIVYMGMSAVHGAEFEGIVGTVNLISVIETGKDLRGRTWPEINEVVSNLDRLILIPIVSPDGRQRIPLRMEKYRDTNYIVHEYINTGGNPDGTIIGWPQVKQYIPLSFTRAGFPGSYPNDNGVNIMHDDFLGSPQPETKALFKLTAKEKPDLIINMHTGAVYMNLHRPFSEPALYPVFDSLYKSVHTRLATQGLLETDDIKKEADPLSVKGGGIFNLDGALNVHCGALSVVVESPSHGFSGKRNNKVAYHSPEKLLDAQLNCHLAAMKFLVKSGGRSKWDSYK